MGMVTIRLSGDELTRICEMVTASDNGPWEKWPLLAYNIEKYGSLDWMEWDNSYDRYYIESIGDWLNFKMFHFLWSLEQETYDLECRDVCMPRIDWQALSYHMRGIYSSNYNWNFEEMLLNKQVLERIELHSGVHPKSASEGMMKLHESGSYMSYSHIERDGGDDVRNANAKGNWCRKFWSAEFEIAQMDQNFVIT